MYNWIISLWVKTLPKSFSPIVGHGVLYSEWIIKVTLPWWICRLVRNRVNYHIFWHQSLIILIQERVTKVRISNFAVIHLYRNRLNSDTSSKRCYYNTTNRIRLSRALFVGRYIPLSKVSDVCQGTYSCRRRKFENIWRPIYNARISWHDIRQLRERRPSSVRLPNSQAFLSIFILGWFSISKKRFWF